MRSLRNFFFIFLFVIIFVILFLLVRHISLGQVELLKQVIPFWLFTLIIALIDSFNPCEIFIFVMLMGLLLSIPRSKFKIYLIGFVFVFITFIFYFVFMAAWLNIIKYVGFIDPVRIALGILAIVIGLINCKDGLFGYLVITLSISTENKSKLYAKIRRLRFLLSNGSMVLVVLSSAILALFASLVEIPCTAGLPVVYTSLLSSKYLSHPFYYYGYLLLYNFIYVLPLIVIILFFNFIVRRMMISNKSIRILKLITGLVMLSLGLILLIHPGVLV